MRNSARRSAGRWDAAWSTLSMPRSILDARRPDRRLAARARAKLTADRAAYFCHPDWMVEPCRGAPEALWQPEIETDEGLAETARWYREAGWL